MASTTISSSGLRPENGDQQGAENQDAAFAQTALVQAVQESPGSPAGASLPAGWRRLPTGCPGTRLYRVSPSGRAVVYWEAMMKLDGKLLRRRFAGELLARAWLTITTEPRSSAFPFDLEELNAAIRTARVVGGSRPPF